MEKPVLGGKWSDDVHDFQEVVWPLLCGRKRPMLKKDFEELLLTAIEEYRPEKLGLAYWWRTCMPDTLKI